jgi:hypothetical protein
MDNNNIEIIYDADLRYKKYDIATLEYNINRLSLRTLLKTQKLTPEFCVKYILNSDDYASCDEDTYICEEDVLIYQKHILQKDLDEIYLKNE